MGDESSLSFRIMGLSPISRDRSEVVAAPLWFNGLVTIILGFNDGDRWMMQLPTLFTPSPPTQRQTWVWFGLSLLVAAIYSGLIIYQAFSQPYIVQDDARQHVFWMRRFIDPELFSGDLIADYFASVAPSGYTGLYRTIAMLGLDPIVFSKIVPALILLVTTAYCFATCVALLPVPIAGFIASVLLNQNLLMADDVNSGTPRAFIYPCFLAFVYYLLKGSRLPCLIAIALLGAFYPQMMLVACGVMVTRLVQWQDGRPRLSPDRDDYLFAGMALAVGAGMMGLYVLEGATEFGPAITVNEARQLPEFWGNGRASFFSDNPFDYWVLSPRSGILPRAEKLLKPPLLFAALVLPFLLRQPQRFPLATAVKPGVAVLGQIILPSIGLFFLAHLVLFKLHHPSRYVQHSYRVVVMLAAGIALTILLEAVVRWGLARSTRRWIMGSLLSGFVVVLLLYPATVNLREALPTHKGLFPRDWNPAFVVGSRPQLYEFFAQQPKDILIASLAREANNLPTFAQRSVLASREYGIPYHVGYYRQFKQRLLDTIQAQYSLDPNVVIQFLRKYGIDYWLIDRQSGFTPNYLNAKKSWLWYYQPAAQQALATLEQGQSPVVQTLLNRCQVFQDGNDLVVLQANCLIQAMQAKD